MADNETIADIIAEIRALSNPISDGIIAINGKSIADRLEAAHRRELSKNVSENKADFGQLGDAAKLRNALKQVNELNDLWFDTFALPDGATSIHDEIENVISAALAATAEKSSAVDDCTKLREAVKAVVEVGYPHNFQHEAPHIRGYCYDITEAIKKCFDALATEKEGGNNGK